MGPAKVKLSDLRATYPMYDQVPDEQFLLGIRKQLYPNIPLQQFTGAIDWDTGPKATDGMSTLDKFLAGAGKAFVDLGRGAGQMVGLVDREDIERSRKEDADLMATGAGMAGNVTGNLAAMLPAVAIPGAASLPGAAAIGAVTGLLSPSTSTQETLTNVGIGGAAGPAGIAAGRVIGSAYQGGKALLAPFTQSGREGIAARTLQRFSGGPDRARGVADQLEQGRSLVPGSNPTAAELSDSGGLAQLQRSMQNIDPERFTQRAQEQGTARNRLLQEIAGTQDDRLFAEEARRGTAADLYGRAMSEGVDPARMTPEMTKRVESLMSRPSIQDAAAQAKLLAREEGIELTDMGSVQGLHYMKKALDDQIASGGKPGGLGPTKQRAVMDTQNRLLEVLDELSPSYGEARRTYSEMSAPINRMEIGQSLYDTVRPAISDYGGLTRENAGAFAKALRAGDATARKATGFPGANMESVMGPENMNKLAAVAQDLARKANANELGRAAGSNTAQNLVSNNLIDQMAGPLGLQGGGSVLLQTILGRPIDWISKASTPEIQKVLTDAMLDPAKAAALLRLVQNPTAAQRLGARAQPLLGVGAVGATQ